MKHLRVLLALSVAFGLMAGLSAPASVGAEGPASRFFGFVFAGEGEPLPVKVRAYGTDGVVCGTASVRVVGEDLGFYQIDVVGASDRAGCPEPGEPVTLWLLYGQVDDGTPASTDADLVFRPGESALASLGSPGVFDAQGWSGAAPPPGGVAILRWNGPDRMPSDEAVALLGVPVRGVWHYDSASRTTLSWVADAPSFVQTYTEVRTGDVVVVRAR